MKTKVISIITQKGGVGKTTSSIHIGGALALLDYKVLLIDFDTQMNLSLGYNLTNDFDFDIKDFLLTEKKPIYHQRGYNNNISIILGSETLKERSLNRNSLKKALEKVKSDFDFIIIDCPPKPINEDLSFGEIAIYSSDFAISPIRADKYSINGIKSFISSVNTLKLKEKLNVNILGFFFNEVEDKTIHFLGFYEMLKNSGAKKLLFDNYVRKDVIVKNAMDEGKTIFEIKPFGRASLDFKKLTNEILDKIKSYEK